MAQDEQELLCIGNSLVDVFACADAEMAAKHGILKPIQHVDIEKLLALLYETETHFRHHACKPGEFNTACPQENLSFTGISSGGGGANAAKIAALLGSKVSFIGAIGSGVSREKAGRERERPDGFGQFFKETLSSAGVKLKLKVKPSPTGICLMLSIADSETRIAASPSAALELSAGDIGEEDIQKARIIVVDGYLLSRPLLVRRILDLAERNGKTAALDLGSPAMAEEYALEIAKYARQNSLILFMNEAEAKSFYKKITNKEYELTDEKPISGKLCDFFISLTAGKKFPIIVIKRGERGALCFSSGAMLEAKTEAVIPADSTGAGDAFCAGFLTAFVRGKSIGECAGIGNRVAHIVLDVKGTALGGEHFKGITDLRS